MSGEATMSGKRLLAYATYVPNYIVRRNAIVAATTGGAGGSGSRAVAGYDEDAITLAVAATLGLPETRRNADALYFATTSQPYADKSNASVIQAAAGLSDAAACIDMIGLRSGLGALRLAATTGGVVAIGDMRSGRPGSVDESESGDGAAAFLFGDDDPNAVAEVIATSSHPSELMDVWRIPGEPFPSGWEERFNTHVLQGMVKEAVDAISSARGANAAPSVVLVSSPNGRFALGASRGPDNSRQAQKNLRQNIGYCGSADVGLQLATALDQARAGDTVLLVAAAGGVDTVLFRVLRDGPGARSDPPKLEASYFQYLTWRGFIDREPTRRPERPPLSAPAAFRNSAWKFALRGARCTACEMVYLPPQRLCGNCGEIDTMERYDVVGRRARIAAVATDGVSDSPAPPAMVATIDVEGGGRLNAELTDTATLPIVGTEVSFTFRRTYLSRGIPNYFWKARPVRGARA